MKTHQNIVKNVIKFATVQTPKVTVLIATVVVEKKTLLMKVVVW